MLRRNPRKGTKQIFLTGVLDVSHLGTVGLFPSCLSIQLQIPHQESVRATTFLGRCFLANEFWSSWLRFRFLRSDGIADDASRETLQTTLIIQLVGVGDISQGLVPATVSGTKSVEFVRMDR